MKNIFIILSKEIRTYFASPMAYIVAAAYLAIRGFFFVASVSDAFSEATIRGYLAGATFFMIFMSPAITMRLIAEEQKLGTLELLLTSPVKEAEVVIGKFLASLVTVSVMIFFSLYFVILLYVFGDPDSGPLFNGIFGLVLYSSATLAIGLFASALSPNQIVGLIVGSGILTSLTIIDFISTRVSGIGSEILSFLQLGASFSVFDLGSLGVSESGHFADFSRGIFSLIDVVFYISVTIVFLLLTIIILESRRWR